MQTIKELNTAGKERTSEIKSTATHEVMTNVFASVGIDTSYVTHSGRHSESIEAQRLMKRFVWLDDGYMTQYYLSNLPVPFARSIASFKDRPFHLRRNEVILSKSLQRMIFPFIDDEYGESEEEHELWLHVCTEEMNDVNKRRRCW
ncbi:hypothetical protein BGZ76_005769 [Entomortierella beljakovae]|nr:hypothetical protein BGZ76_005769 [Entomortierella beljakovae]